MAARVIIVEDELLTCHAFALALKTAGFEVMEASDVFAARGDDGKPETGLWCVLK